MNRLRLALSVLAAASVQIACASPATAPKASPVYGDALNPQVEPISVETASLKNPESRTLGERSGGPEAEAPAEADESTQSDDSSSKGGPSGASNGTPQGEPSGDAHQATKAPVDKAPVDKAPVDKAPVDKAPVDKAPVDKAPIDKAPVDKAPVDKAPAAEKAVSQ